MKWIIKHLTDGTYVVSSRFFVYHAEFARRFASKKQADAYIASSGFDRGRFIAAVLQGETDKKERQ